MSDYGFFVCELSEDFYSAMSDYCYDNVEVFLLQCQDLVFGYGYI